MLLFILNNNIAVLDLLVAACAFCFVLFCFAGVSEVCIHVCTCTIIVNTNATIHRRRRQIWSVEAHAVLREALLKV